MKNYHYRNLIVQLFFVLISIPATFAQITSVTPNIVAQGQTLNIDVTTSNINFLQGSNTIKLNQNSIYITGTNVTILDTGKLRATFSFNSNHPTGNYTCYVSNGLGTSYSLSNALLLNPYTSAPVLDSISPKSGKQAELITIRLYGTNTHFNKNGASNSAWLKNGSLQSNAVNINVIDSVTLDAQFNIGYFYPTGIYSIYIENIYDGTLTKTDAFELLPGDNMPAITTLSPDSALQGQTLDIEITCENTNFIQGSNIVSLKQNTTTISPNHTSIISPTKLLANYTFTTGHATGNYDIRITDYNTYNITKAGAFELIPGTNVPAIVSLSPSSASQGQTLNIEITCENTSFTQGSNSLNLKQNSTTIYPNNVSVLNDSILSANFTFSGAHPTGKYTLNIVNYNTNLSKPDAFELLPGSTSPTIVSLNPDTASIGQTLDIDVTCRNIVFYQGTNTITLKQNGTTIYPIGTTEIINDTILRAKFAFNSGFPSGNYSANVYTNGTTLTKTNAFVILGDGLPQIISLTPSTGMQDQTLNINITCENTNFTQGSNTLNLKQNGTTIYPNNISVVNDTIVNANFTFTVSHPIGYYTINIINYNTSLSKTNAFELLPSNTTPAIVSLNPDTASIGQTLDIDVTCRNVVFYQGSSAITFTLKQNSTTIYPTGTVNIVNDSVLQAGFAFTSGVPSGSYSANVYANGTTLTKANAFVVLSDGSPRILSLSPATGMQDQMLDIDITCENTNFFQGSNIISVNLKQDTATIIPNSVTPLSATKLRANFTFSIDQPLGYYTINVSNGGSNISKTSAFQLLANTMPKIISVSPTSAFKGQTLDIEVTGENTYFYQGSNTIYLKQNSTYIYANYTTVLSTTKVKGNFTFTSNNPGGNYDVYVMGMGMVSKANAFELLSTSITLDSISPANAKWGENVTIKIYAKNSHFTESGITNSVKLKKSSAEIEALSVTVIDTATLEAQFVLTSAPTTGFYDIIVENSYDGPATLSGAFEVQAILGQPAIISVTPDIVIPYSTLDISITGENVDFTQGTNVISLKDKYNNIIIYPHSFVVNSATSITASFTIMEFPLDGMFDLYVNNISTGINLIKEDAISMNVVIDIAEKTEEKLDLFPNPVSNFLNISGTFEKVQIFDLKGRLLIDSRDKKIDVSKLRNGVYIVKINSNKGCTITKKIFKQ